MNKDQGQRGGDGRTEEVNRAEDDSNPFDLLPDELLKMIIEPDSPSGLSRGSFVTAFTRLHNVCSRFRRIVMPHQRFYYHDYTSRETFVLDTIAS